MVPLGIRHRGVTSRGEGEGKPSPFEAVTRLGYCRRPPRYVGMSGDRVRRCCPPFPPFNAESGCAGRPTKAWRSRLPRVRIPIRAPAPLIFSLPSLLSLEPNHIGARMIQEDTQRCLTVIIRGKCHQRASQVGVGDVARLGQDLLHPRTSQSRRGGWWSAKALTALPGRSQASLACARIGKNARRGRRACPTDAHRGP